MSAIKLHLEDEESAAVDRLADQLKVKSEDVIYAALNRLMMQARENEVRKDIVETSNWRSDNLPLWADSARSVHAYEGRQDDEPEPSKYA